MSDVMLAVVVAALVSLTVSLGPCLYWLVPRRADFRKFTSVDATRSGAQMTEGMSAGMDPVRRMNG